MALSVECGGYISNTKPSSIEQVLNIYESAYKKAGFVVTKKEVSKESAEFWATLIVPSSPYQEEVREQFSLKDISIKGIYHCPLWVAVKEPKEYDVSTRNAYLSKVEKSVESIEKNIQIELKNKFGE